MLQSLFCYILCSMAVIVKCDSLFYYKFQRRLLRSASVRFISKCKGGYCLYKVLRSLDWRVRSLGDVTAHGRVQDWPSRERLGTRLASPFSPFYTPLLTIDHPLSIICLLVQAFLVCKTARILKNLQTTFSQNSNNFENFGEIFSHILYIYTFLSGATIFIAFVPVNVYALKFGKKITFLHFSKKCQFSVFLHT